MTFNTNRKYIKRFRVIWMMIFLCLRWTITAFQGIRSRQFTISYNYMYGTSCSALFRMSKTITFSSSFAFFILSVTFFSYFALFCFFITKITFTARNLPFFCLLIFLSIFRPTYYTYRPMVVFISCTFVKLRNWFELLARTASFGYDCFRHNRFLNKRFCLEPVAAHTAVGSTYYKVQR